MNKYQETLEFFAKLTNRVPLKFANDEFCEKYDKNLVLVKELVDKETPNKILRTVNDNGEPFLPRGYGECPKCKTKVAFRDKYCRECGQRLE